MPAPGGVAVWGRSRERHSFRRVCMAVLAAAVVMTSFALPAAAAPPAAPPPEAEAAPVEVNQNVEAVIAAARSHLGIPYRVGSEGPGLFDCSGLVYRVFQETGQLERIGGARLRAAGYMRWFMGAGRAFAAEENAERGDLVIFGHGAHIGIYLGDGRVLSAITSGVTVHSLHGITIAPTAFLKVDWTGEGGPLADPSLFDVLPETPVSLVKPAAWVPIPGVEDVVNQPGPARAERVDMRTANSHTFENADGTFTTELHARPIYFQAADSTDWQPIDLSFETSDDARTAQVTDSPVTVTVADTRAETGFITLDAGERRVALRPATAGRARTLSSPVVSLDGRFADYFGFAAADVGLRVLPRTDGFKGFLVLRDEPRVNRFSFAIDAPGLTLAAELDGSISMRDEAGAVVGRLPRPLLLDSSDDDGNGGGVFTAATTISLATDGVLPVVTVAVERRYLDEAVYPAFVDLSVTDFPGAVAGADLTFASSRHPNANFERYQRPEGAAYSELWHGHQPGSRSDNEIYVRFPGILETLGTVDIASAALELFPYWQREESAAPTIVRRATEAWDPAALTWNSRPSTSDEELSAASDAGTWSSIDVSSYVADTMAGGADYGLVLAGDNSGATTWKRFVAEGKSGASDLGPRLSVTWSGLRPSGIAQDSAATVAPRVSWTHAAVAPDQHRFQVQVSRDGFVTSVVESGTVKGRKGAITEWTVPTQSLYGRGSYSWRVRVKYGDDRSWSAWSVPQTFSYGVPQAEVEIF